MVPPSTRNSTSSLGIPDIPTGSRVRIVDCPLEEWHQKHYCLQREGITTGFVLQADRPDLVYIDISHDDQPLIVAFPAWCLEIVTHFYENPK